VKREQERLGKKGRYGVWELLNKERKRRKRIKEDRAGRVEGIFYGVIGRSRKKSNFRGREKEGRRERRGK